MPTKDIRKSELAQIHIGKTQLGMDEETYRAMLQNVAGVESSSRLDGYGRRKVIAHLKAKGASLGRSDAPKKVARDKDKLIGKIGALLADMQLPWAYADGCARKMFSIEKTEWCDADQLHRIVAGLSYHQKRLKEKGAKHGGAT
jgi:phage gp16-like protein